MSINSQQLMELLPAIHRIRDAEIAEQSGLDNGPLEDLMSIIAEQLAVMEENIEQSYDDLFIETCADWLTSYIGDVIGYQSLHGNVPDVASPREEVAHTIALRRRKGTAVVLEQLARDVTGWDARAVEFFKQLGWTQYMNHDRKGIHYCPDFRDMEPLARIGSAFNSVQHTVDVRRVETAHGRFNIPNIGIFIWRLDALSHTWSPALRLASRRYLISPLGHNLQLYSRPANASNVFITELARPENVPEALTRRQLHDHLDSYYGIPTGLSGADEDKASIMLKVDGVEITRNDIIACNLSDDGADWAHQPPDDKYAIDPVLGRIALPANADDPAEVQISYHRGFSANMGGGEYERKNSFSLGDSTDIQLVPDQHSTIQKAIDALDGIGVVEITDNNRYEETLTIDIDAGEHVELRAANERHPHLALTGPLSITGGEDSHCSINGCLISGDLVTVPDNGSNALSSLKITHCTLVPGRTLNADGSPAVPAAVSLRLEIADVQSSINHSIIGGIRAVPEAAIALQDCIVDATDIEAIAYSDLDDDGPGATLDASTSTVIGKIRAREFGTVSNCILMASLSATDIWNAPVWTERKQTGCVRFSFLPFESIVPRRYRCQPDSDTAARKLSPRFTTLKYGEAAYAQLSPYTAEEIWRGADDESEMGAFHHLYAPQRDRNLRIRLREYLRVGLEAGIFYES